MEFGPYRLEQILGAGGFGQVFRAYKIRTNRASDAVAVKILPLPLLANDEERLQYGENRARFLRECEIVSQLTNPHTVPVNTYGDVDGQLYLEMRLLEGADLHGVLKNDGKLEPYRAVRLIEQVAGSLDEAHVAGLLHRDIKPANIFVARDDDGADFCYLIDFGIARAQLVPDGQIITQQGALFGTPAYMAPEVFENDGYDRRADVYSLACVLFQCLTGTPPFIYEGWERLRLAHLVEDPPLITELELGLPASLARVVARGLEKDPRLRFATASELARSARASLSGYSAPTERDVMIFSYALGDVRVWDIQTASFIGHTFDQASAVQNLIAISAYGGEDIIVSSSSRNVGRNGKSEIWIWRMKSGRVIGPPILESGKITHLVTSTWGGESIVISASRASRKYPTWETTTFRRLVDGEVIWSSEPALAFPLAAGETTGKDQFLAWWCHHPNRIEFLDLRSRKRISILSLSEYYIQPVVTVGLYRNRPVAVVGGYKQDVYVFDVEHGCVIYHASPVRDNSGSVGQVTVHVSNDRMLLVEIIPTGMGLETSQVRIIDIQSGKSLWRSSDFYPFDVRVANTARGGWLFFSRFSGKDQFSSPAVWDIEDGRIVEMFAGEGRRRIVGCVPHRMNL